MAVYTKDASHRAHHWCILSDRAEGFEPKSKIDFIFVTTEIGDDGKKTETKKTGTKTVARSMQFGQEPDKVLVVWK